MSIEKSNSSRVWSFDSGPSLSLVLSSPESCPRRLLAVPRDCFFDGLKVDALVSERLNSRSLAGLLTVELFSDWVVGGEDG